MKGKIEVVILKRSNAAKLHQGSPQSLGLTLKQGICKHRTTELNREGENARQQSTGCPVPEVILRTQKFPGLSPAAAPAPCESRELPCDQQAEFLPSNKARFKRPLRSTNSLGTEEAAGGQDAAETRQLTSPAVPRRAATQPRTSQCRPRR